MNKNICITENTEPLIHIKRDQVITTSLDVAEKFGKKHNNVLTVIRRIVTDRLDFGRLNFKQSYYLNEQNKRQPFYEMTRSGFSILAMGFTGKKALDWKIKYEDAFNAMSMVLANQANPAWQELRSQGKDTRFKVTETIEKFVEYARMQGSRNAPFYYNNITKTANKALFITPTKSSENLRDLLDIMQLSFLQTAEFMLINTLNQGMSSNLHYKEIYQLCKSRLQAFAENVGPTSVIYDSQITGLASNS